MGQIPQKYLKTVQKWAELTMFALFPRLPAGQVTLKTAKSVLNIQKVCHYCVKYVKKCVTSVSKAQKGMLRYAILLKCPSSNPQRKIIKK